MFRVAIAPLLLLTACPVTTPPGTTSTSPSDTATSETLVTPVRVLLRLDLGDGPALPISGAQVTLRDASGVEVPFSARTDLDGVVGETLDLAAGEWTTCWTLAGGTAGCEDVPSVTAGERTLYAAGPKWTEDMVRGRVTLADGLTPCETGIQHLGPSCRPDTLRVKTKGGEVELTGVVSRLGFYLADGVPLASEVTVETVEGAVASAVVVGGLADVALPMPGLRVTAVIDGRTGPPYTVRVDAFDVSPDGVGGLIVARTNPNRRTPFHHSFRVEDVDLLEGTAPWTPDPGITSVQACAVREDGVGACAPTQFLPPPPGTGRRVVLGADKAGLTAGPAGDRLDVEGDGTPLDADGGGFLEGPVTWIRGPGHVPAATVIPEGFSSTLAVDASACLSSVEAVPAADLLRVDDVSSTTWTTADGTVTLKVPTGSVTVGGLPLPKTATPRIARVTGDRSLPVDPIGASPEWVALSPEATLWVSFDDETGTPLDAVALPGKGLTATVKLDAPYTGTGKGTAWTLTDPFAPTWTPTTITAGIANDEVTLPLDLLGWTTVAEPFEPGCVSVFVDQLASYDSVFVRWTTSGGQTVTRVYPISSAPVTIGALPLGTTVTVSLGTKCQEDPDTVRTVVVGLTRAAHPVDIEPFDACTEVVVPATPTFPTPAFLTRFLLEDATDGNGVLHVAPALAQDYYDTIDPYGQATTLEDWKTNLCGWPTTGAPDAHATYQNQADLGFVRDMFSYTGPDGRVCMYVTNYADFDTFLAGTPLATVAMDYAPAPDDTSTNPPFFVRFYVFDQYGTTRLTSINLDNFGLKSVPQLCMNCHGGNWVSSQDVANNGWANHGDVGGRFIPFDPNAYGFLATLPGGVPSGLDRATQLDQFRLLNEGVLRALDDPETRAVVHGWYGSTAVTSDSLPAGVTPDFDWIPPGWSYGPVEEEAYAEVVAQNCRLCHQSHSNPMLDFDQASELRFWFGSAVNDICNARVMPHALRTFQNLYGQTEPRPIDVLTDFYGASGQYFSCSF